MRLKAGHRLDPHIGKAFNSPGLLEGEISNRKNIGKTADDLVALWKRSTRKIR